MMKMNVKVGDTIRIGDVLITVEDKAGKMARLAIDADKSVPIERVQATSAAQLASRGLTGKP